MTGLEDKTRYDPAEVEPRIEQEWLASGLTHPAPDGTAAENYSIAMPPPNVTGVLHMGHALNNAIQDTLIRHARMTGPPSRRTKWIVGTDHAGIATQTQVERQLVSLGTSREEVGRDQFVARVWTWREQYGHQIIEQLKRLGVSADFADERFTFDAAYERAVLTVFVALYEKGWIYRDRYMVNWDPGSRSAISDLEVEEREVTDTLYSIDYPLASGGGAITVATVRPETMLGDVAIAVHPDDERYRRLIGEFAVLPIVGRRLRIIADEYVKPEFGTGALKITPGHDPNDFEIGRRHGLPTIGVIGEDGRMEGDEVPVRFAGLTAREAQEAIVRELADAGLVARAQPYTHTVPFSHRSGERIEPLISLQWFMRMDELAEPAIDVVRRGEIRFHPENQTKVYLDWMENIRPWCISRQLWWGHQIPVWYRFGETYCGLEPPAGEGWTRDPDVLDTWFSSGLWPFATLGWPDATPELRAFYPTNVLSTARDIIFLWVARMIMFGIEFTGQIPFEDVYVHSIIQAPDGRRMSKSLGTGIDPIALIDGGPRPPVFAPSPGADPGSFPAYGADAVRWGLLSMSSGQDVRFNEEAIAQGQRLTNKLWNASRLILLRVAPQTRAAARPQAVEDQWILSRLASVAAQVNRRIERFDFSRVAGLLYDFVFGELCDWYLELVKPRLNDGDPQTAATLLYLLTETVALAHPVIPFVTEEIWAHIPGAEGLLAERVDPVAGGAGDTLSESDRRAQREIDGLITAVQAVRGWRDAAEVKWSAVLPAQLQSDRFERSAAQLARLARLEFRDAGAGDVAATIPVPGGQIVVFASGAVDLGAADRKRDELVAKLAAEIDRAQKKLANAGFVAKAPTEVVDAERTKLTELEEELARLTGERAGSERAGS